LSRAIVTIEAAPEPSGLGQGLVQIAIVALLGGLLIWLADGDGMAQARAFVSSTNRPAEAAASTGLAPAACLPSEIRMTGVFNGCAFDSGPETGFGVHPPPLCVTPTPGPDFSVFMHLRDATRDYLLYVQVVGRYHGPGVYDVAPWPKPSGPNRGHAGKVAVREFITGQLWESTAGKIRVDPGGGSGMVQATLQRVALTSGGATRTLRIDGPWRCD
jgi:hypothetical protein